jgi:rhodanese-related sulfurtransferase
MFAFVPAVSAERLAAMRENGQRPLIVDLRDATQYRAGALPGSVSIPPDELLPARITALLGRAAGTGVPLYLVSSNGRMAERAALRLRNAGLQQVFPLDGGIVAWRAAGWPLQRHARPVALTQQLNLLSGVALLALLAKAWLLHPVFYLLAALLGLGLIWAGLADRRWLRRRLLALPWNRRRHVSRGTTMDGLTG